MSTNKFASVAAQAAQVQDFKETTKGGDFKDPVTEKVQDGHIMLLRFRSYIELGTQKSTNPKYRDSPKARFGFEVCSPMHVDKAEDGTEIRGRIEFECNISNNESSSYSKLFKAMDYGRGNNVFAQMLGDGFLATAKVKLEGTGKDQKKYVNVVGKEFCTVRAPRRIDELTQESTPINVPELMGEMQCFLWEFPTKEQWDSIYIEGTKDDGSSKNWIQEKVMSALDYPGSLLENMLASDWSAELPDPAAAAEQVQEPVTDAVGAAASALGKL